MNYPTAHPLMERWHEDPEFRHALRKDPAGTVKRAGLPMTEEQWDALRALDWNLEEPELLTRLEHWFC